MKSGDAYENRTKSMKCDTDMLFFMMHLFSLHHEEKCMLMRNQAFIIIFITGNTECVHSLRAAAATGRKTIQTALQPPIEANNVQTHSPAGILPHGSLAEVSDRKYLQTTDLK